MIVVVGRDDASDDMYDDGGDVDRLPLEYSGEVWPLRVVLLAAAHLPWCEVLGCSRPSNIYGAAARSSLSTSLISRAPRRRNNKATWGSIGVPAVDVVIAAVDDDDDDDEAVEPLYSSCTVLRKCCCFRCPLCGIVAVSDEPTGTICEIEDIFLLLTVYFLDREIELFV